MIKGKLYYVQTVPYVVIVRGSKAITRRARNIEKDSKTCTITLDNKEQEIRFYY